MAEFTKLEQDAAARSAADKRLNDTLRAENARLREPTCQLSGPGRGDCSHFVGLHGQLTDDYGKPVNWCWWCWRSVQLERLRKPPNDGELLIHDLLLKRDEEITALKADLINQASLNNGMLYDTTKERNDLRAQVTRLTAGLAEALSRLEDLSDKNIHHCWCRPPDIKHDHTDLCLAVRAVFKDPDATHSHALWVALMEEHEAAKEYLSPDGYVLLDRLVKAHDAVTALKAKDRP